MAPKSPDAHHPLNSPSFLEEIIMKNKQEEALARRQEVLLPYEDDQKFRVRLRFAETQGVQLDFLVDHYLDEIPMKLERAGLTSAVTYAVWQFLAEVALEQGNLKRCAQCMVTGRVLVSFHALQRMRPLKAAEVMALMTIAQQMGAEDYAEELRLWLETGDPNAPFRRTYDKMVTTQATRKDTEAVLLPGKPVDNSPDSALDRSMRDGKEITLSTSPAYREKYWTYRE